MNNLETLYREDGAFRVDAIKRAADFIGTTSLEFAEQWLTDEPEPIQLKDMFGVMRDSTDDEREAYERMRDKHSVDTGVNIFDLPTDPGEAAIESVNAFIAEHEPDSYGKLDADIDSWLGKWPGLSVRVADVKEKIMGWIDRACRIRERNLGHVRESWAKRIDDQSREIAALKAERDNLADDLLTCNREREQLRKHLGIALDHAHDICSLVDIDGNVLDVGD